MAGSHTKISDEVRKILLFPGKAAKARAAALAAVPVVSSIDSAGEKDMLASSKTTPGGDGSKSIGGNVIIADIDSNVISMKQLKKAALTDTPLPNIIFVPGKTTTPPPPPSPNSSSGSNTSISKSEKSTNTKPVNSSRSSSSSSSSNSTSTSSPSQSGTKSKDKERWIVSELDTSQLLTQQSAGNVIPSASPIDSCVVDERTEEEKQDELICNITSVSEVQVYYRDDGRIAVKVDVFMDPNITIRKANQIAREYS